MRRRSEDWQSDVRIAFRWLREALRKPLRPGSRVFVVSSGAALAGRHSGAGTPAPALHSHADAAAIAPAYVVTGAGLQTLS